MQLSEAVQNRRSVRLYEEDPLDLQELRNIVEAALMAPSAGNAQPWRFLIVRDPQRLDWLCAVAPGVIGRPAAMIVICGTNEEELISFDWMSIGASLQNLLLTAYALGVGACPVGSFHKAAVKEMLDLPEGQDPILLIACGIPAEIPQPPERKDLREYYALETWGANGYE